MKVLCCYAGFGERWKENIKCQLSDWSEARGDFLIFIFLFGKNTQQHTPVLAVIVSAEEVGTPPRWHGRPFDLFFLLITFGMY